MLIKLMLGALQFRNKPFAEMKMLFEQLSQEGQNPETLFITCADSRIIPSLITQAPPGDLFVLRNIGNIIPPFPSLSSEAGGLEYALTAFKIKDIIICGHSQCGAMNGILAADLEGRVPTAAAWLRHSDSALKKMQEHHPDQLSEPSARLSALTKENILLQIEHLKTYPQVREQLARNELTIHGWLYELESGKIFIYEQKLNEFICLDDALILAIEARKNKICASLAMEYLEKLSHPQSAKEYQLLMQLFDRLQNNIVAIWELIKEPLQQKLWMELGGFYADPLDQQFVALMESGSQIKLTDLKRFQKHIVESEGYHQYCHQLARTSFFSTPPQRYPILIESQSSLDNALFQAF